MLEIAAVISAVALAATLVGCWLVYVEGVRLRTGIAVAAAVKAGLTIWLAARYWPWLESAPWLAAGGGWQW